MFILVRSSMQSVLLYSLELTQTRNGHRISVPLTSHSRLQIACLSIDDLPVKGTRQHTQGYSIKLATANISQANIGLTYELHNNEKL